MQDWLEPVLDAEQMRAVDRWAIEKQGIPSVELMEAAGQAIAQAVADLPGSGPVRVVCGKGNNGGDGLVAARILTEMGFTVDAFLITAADELSPDARSNFDLFPNALTMTGEGLSQALEGSAVVVDAVFGTGFEGEPRDPAGTAIEAINASGATVVAADIPSGVNASTGEVSGEAVHADVTISFHAAKIGHYVSPGKQHRGKLRVVPIGIPEGAPDEAHAGILRSHVVNRAPRRKVDSTKFTSGRVMVVGGSRGLTGAVCLTARAAIRTGAGYATALVPLELESIFEMKLTEVMTIGLPGRDGHLRPAADERLLEACKGAEVVAFGPGLGKNSGAKTLAQEASLRISSTLVLDADGLNALAGSLHSLAGREAPTVLTPHAGELARLMGTESEVVNARRLVCAQEAAKQARAVVVLKGDDTIVTDGERVAINKIESPGLATAGTGDVLTGMISALIARGMEPFDAACTGVVAHARAGVAAAKRMGAESVIASDVIAAIPAGLARS
jgi:ADP-dependent NAD(P)H-hydrate dehydratase / NAD(P)H-hydrate epimerase